jgi:hypothetical protein
MLDLFWVIHGRPRKVALLRLSMATDSSRDFCEYVSRISEMVVWLSCNSFRIAWNVSQVLVWRCPVELRLWDVSGGRKSRNALESCLRRHDIGNDTELVHLLSVTELSDGAYQSVSWEDVALDRNKGCFSRGAWRQLFEEFEHLWGFSPLRNSVVFAVNRGQVHLTPTIKSSQLMRGTEDGTLRFQICQWSVSAA